MLPVFFLYWYLHRVTLYKTRVQSVHCVAWCVAKCYITDFVARGKQTSKSSNNWPFNASQTGEHTHAADGSVKHAPFDASTELPSMVGSAVSFCVALFCFGRCVAVWCVQNFDTSIELPSMVGSAVSAFFFLGCVLQCGARNTPFDASREFPSMVDNAVLCVLRFVFCSVLQCGARNTRPSTHQQSFLSWWVVNLLQCVVMLRVKHTLCSNVARETHTLVRTNRASFLGW